ncbi:MAG: T9SS type A sorting domain-containing protein [Ignavibacterium sp.]|nr:T9SS type A sorting domain-containing protein [Ignavibacterium sp.]
MKNIYLALFFSLIITEVIISQVTIHSTLGGGKWHLPTTWIEGVVPGASDNVVIQGPVQQHYVTGYDIHPVYCNDLTITSNGILSNGDYGGGTGIFAVYVAGDVINNGVVTNGSEDFLKIFLAGDIENNNIWMPYETEFQVSENHNLSLAPGKSFGSKIINNNTSLTALTNLYFTCDWNTGGNSYRGHFYLNGHTLNMGNHSIELHPNCLINKGKLQGNFEIVGTFTTGWADGYDIKDTLIFEGNITVTDTLRGNAYGGGYGIYKLRINGNITNNGVIKDDYDTDDPLNNDDLNILVTGNINNNGIWGCNYTTFIGTEPQFIYQSNGKYFDCFINDINSASSIIAQSDITVTKDINLNGALLDMGSHTLKLSTNLKNGIISNCTLQNGILQNINSINSLKIRGKVTVNDGNCFQNTIIVEDTLQSDEYGGGSKVFTLQIIGDITNNGVIRNNNPGDKLSLEIFGDIYNHSIFENSFIKFVGLQDQTIFQSIGSKFITAISDLDSTSKLIALSNLLIEGDCNLNQATIQMDNYEINLTGSLYNGYIKSAIIKNAQLKNVTVFDNAEIRGIVKIDDGNKFCGNLFVTDTLQSIPYGGGAHTYKLYIYGNLENNGLIRDEPTQSEDFAVYIMGYIVNHGSFSNYRIYQYYYQDNSSNSIQCFNTGSSDWIFNGANITDNNSNAFSIISGGGTQTIQPNQSYDLTIQYTPTTGDSTAILNINCAEIGTLSTIYLIGNNFNQPVDVEEKPEEILPEGFALYQNYPNPFNPSTTIRYTIPLDAGSETQEVSLKVYDVLGNEIATLVNDEKESGNYTVEFNASYLSSGVYFYQLKAGDFVQTRKMLLAK